jgi:riboflavin transporter FmnP
MRLKRTTVKVAGVAVLAPLSVIMQTLPPLFLTPWFMRIDLVAVPWILCWALFGFKAALLCLLVSVPLVGVLGPFAGGWVGAIMKSIASVWMFAIPALFTWKRKASNSPFMSWKSYALASVLAVAVRAMVTVVFNIYFAIPFFFEINPVEFFSNPMFLSFFGHSLGLIGLGAAVAEIAFWNIIQGTIDLYVSFMILLIILRRVPGLAETGKTT